MFAYIARRLWRGGALPAMMPEGKRTSRMLDYERLDRLAEELRGSFASAEPFPHVVIDDFLPTAVAETVLKEFQDTREGWKHYHHYNERKRALTDVEHMPPHTRELIDEFQSERMAGIVGRLASMDGLISDPDLEGAGMHQVERGGFLNIHTDFLTHAKRGSWRRKINLILYLNQTWEPDWRGNLEFWDARMSRCVRSVTPEFNRCVMFATVPNSFHGHPQKLACPEAESRKALLLYYYRDEGHELEATSTDYRALPDASWLEKALVAGDRLALRLYTLLKRRSKLSDEMIARLLKRF
jgi:Rps23 Pro-64 3,4-dihydroxylase Tpa1-like proline 4-hydroxylase